MLLPLLLLLLLVLLRLIVFINVLLFGMFLIKPDIFGSFSFFVFVLFLFLFCFCFCFVFIFFLFLFSKRVKPITFFQFCLLLKSRASMKKIINSERAKNVGFDEKHTEKQDIDEHNQSKQHKQQEQQQWQQH